MSAKYVGSRFTLFFEIENTLRFLRVPHCAGSRLILFREMSRISNDGISQSCCQGQWFRCSVMRSCPNRSATGRLDSQRAGRR